MEEREIYPRQQLADDEIDLIDLIRTLWSWKWLIVASTFLFTLGAGLFGYLQPTEYRASVLVSPTQDRGSSGGIGGQLGGVAAMAGIDVGEGVSATDRAFSLMRSRRFLMSLIEEEDLLPYLFPEHWDEEKEEWQEELWQEEADVWHRDDGGWRVEEGVELPHPLPSHGVSRLREAIGHSEEDGGLRRITVDLPDRVGATKVANLLIRRTNAVMRSEEINRLERRLEHLQEQVANTTISGVRQSLYNIMESSYESRAVAQTERDYIFSIIDPAIPEDTSTTGVAAKLYAALGMVLGGMLGVFGAFVGAFIRNNFFRPESSEK